MSEPEKSYADFVVDKVDDDLITLEDGYVYFAPKNYGALNADHLRVIADELDRRNKKWNDYIKNNLKEEIAKASASSRIWFSKEPGCVNVVFDEESWNRAALESLGLASQLIIPIPKPGDHVSFPVACLTGSCFKKWGQVYRWIEGKLHQWISGQWRETNLSSTETQGEFVVVEEPNVPEPVWKDCNFIEAVEWMKAKPTENKACWNNSLFHVDADIVFDEAKSPLMSRENEIEPVLGKWRIPVQ